MLSKLNVKLLFTKVGRWPNDLRCYFGNVVTLSIQNCPTSLNYIRGFSDYIVQFKIFLIH